MILRKIPSVWFKIGMVLVLALFYTACAHAQGASLDTSNYLASLPTQPKTLWQLILAGGWTMFFIGLLSLGGLALVIYDFRTIDVNKLAPRKFCEDLISKLEEGSLASVKGFCQKNNNIISRIVLAGIEKNQKGKSGVIVKEAMENTARIEIASLWQNISYFSDIAQIAPLLGLLGNVLGIIQAFNVIVVQSVGVKATLLAGGVAKAMVTTAFGLIVAIPTLVFYAYFRGKVQEVTNIVGTYTDDVIKIMEKL